MACMEHWCGACGHTEFNNRPGAGSCPKCGSRDVVSTFDEPAEDHAPADYYADADDGSDEED